MAGVIGFQVQAEAEKLQPKEAAEVRVSIRDGVVSFRTPRICRVSDGPRERWKWPNPWSANWWRKLRQSRCSAVLLYSSNPQWPFSTFFHMKKSWNMLEQGKKMESCCFWLSIKSQCFWNRSWMARVEDSKGKREVLDKVAQSLSSAHPSGQRVKIRVESVGDCGDQEISSPKLHESWTREVIGTAPALWGSLSYQ